MRGLFLWLSVFGLLGNLLGPIFASVLLSELVYADDQLEIWQAWESPSVPSAILNSPTCRSTWLLHPAYCPVEYQQQCSGSEVGCFASNTGFAVLIAHLAVDFAALSAFLHLYAAAARGDVQGAAAYAALDDETSAAVSTSEPRTRSQPAPRFRMLLARCGWTGEDGGQVTVMATPFLRYRQWTSPCQTLSLCIALKDIFLGALFTPLLCLLALADLLWLLLYPPTLSGHGLPLVRYLEGQRVYQTLTLLLESAVELLITVSLFASGYATLVSIAFALPSIGVTLKRLLLLFFASVPMCARCSRECCTFCISEVEEGDKRGGKEKDRQEAQP